MNDRTAVKSPENAGFKPKNRELRIFTPDERQARRRAVARSPTAPPSARHAIRSKRSRFDKKERKLTENRRKLRCRRLTAAAFGASLLRFSG
jgi:hypothetical protein